MLRVGLRMHWAAWLVVAGWLTSGLTTPAHAQGAGGQIEGTVRDEEAAVLPGATVTLRNEQTGVTRVAATDGSGQYRFPALAPGLYGLRIELQGFATAEAKEMTITIGLTLIRDLSMKLQSVSE